LVAKLKMGARKIPARLHAVGNPEYQRLVGWAADQTKIGRATAFEFIGNLITAYEAHAEVTRSRATGDAPRVISDQPKGIM